MTAGGRIVEALSPFGWPVVPGVNLGAEQSYFVFNCGALPVDFGDDAPAHERVLAQVHLFCPFAFNSIATRRLVCRRLFAAGFTWPSITDATAEVREGIGPGQHVIFECELAEGVLGDG